ncbi:hypothetical protein [Microbacterium sp. XT11]|uniref:hypothetical protein n=1 Tax=Microbacterium sp. XT11 TaxID=367477 RepID=UPI0012F95726|nr:hypothetical protein [Microbacterium sp. XT11]
MSTVIVHSAGTITPKVVQGFESARAARTIVHTILGRADPDITYRPAALRSGTLTLVFANGADAAAAEAVLVMPQTFTLSDTAVPQVAMKFVVAGGDVVRTLDDGTRTVWTVKIPFREVAP